MYHLKLCVCLCFIRSLIHSTNSYRMPCLHSVDDTVDDQRYSKYYTFSELAVSTRHRAGDYMDRLPSQKKKRQLFSPFLALFKPPQNLVA